MRKLDGFPKHFTYLIGIAMVLYSITAIFIPREPWLFRATHLTFALIMVFWLIPPRKKEDAEKETGPTILDIILSVMSAAVLVYIYVEFSSLIYRVSAFPTVLDIIAGLILIILVLEATRRAAGLAFVIVALLALAYTYLGPYLPGLLGHKGYTTARTISYVFSTEGVYGSTLRASASFAILFITLGAFFKAFGAADFFNDFAMATSGHTRGGPGKVAVIASCLFGTISGHAAGNVATTGTFTIPLMKKTGYKSAFAGAVEAAASTGGQIMPPVMGTVIFVMIELTGINYSKLMIAAALPAILYYVAVFLLVDFEAINLNLVGLPRDQLPSVKEALKKGYFFLIAIFVLLYLLLIKKSSISSAAIYTIVSVVVISLFRIRNSRIMLKKILDALYRGGVGTIKLAPLTAAAGVVIGVVTLTGIGVKLGRFLLTLSGGNLFFILFFAMILSIILGMGMSTIPAYVIAAVVVAPALIEVGVPVLPAHLFVLYYAIISTITPPIAISAFTAAGIAEAEPMQTGFKAVKLAYVGFIVPFLFVYRPALLAQGTTIQVIYAIIISVIAIYSLSRGIQLKKHSRLERMLLILGSAIMLIPWYDFVGLVLVAISYITYFLRNQKRQRSDDSAYG